MVIKSRNLIVHELSSALSYQPPFQMGLVTFQYNRYYGYTFSAFSDEEIAALEDNEDQKTASNWNDVIKAMELTSYFYGVNKDYVFYIYFSDFGD